MSDTGTRCMWMRGGTSKGGYFLADDLPADVAARDELLLRVMGSPDARQIDGMGVPAVDQQGGRGLALGRADADIDYLFLRVFVDQAIVTDAQRRHPCRGQRVCHERGLVEARGGWMCGFSCATRGRWRRRPSIRSGVPSYAGDEIDISRRFGSVALVFDDVAGSMAGLLPTRNAVDVIDVEVTMIDNGMPVVVMRAADLGIMVNARRNSTP